MRLCSLEYPTENTEPCARTRADTTRQTLVTFRTHRDGSALAHERNDRVVAPRPACRLHGMENSSANMNLGMLRFLMSVTPRAVQTRATQTSPGIEASGAQPSPTSKASGMERALAPDFDAAPCESELVVYKPWTGVILEVLSLKDEECSDESTYVSTLSVGELRDMLGCGNRPHTNQRCYQGFITDVRLEVQRSVGFANHQNVSYTPVYNVWLPADGSLFEVSGFSLPHPLRRSGKNSWSNSEVLAMESYALGEGALEHGLMGDEFTWIPVLCKSCRTRVCMKKDFSAIKVVYPPTELRTSKHLPDVWQAVCALPPVEDAPLYEEFVDPTRSFPHIGRIGAARQLAFTPVLLRDVLTRNAEITEEHRALYHSKCNRFLAQMRPLYELVAGGGDPREHGWTQLARNTERGVVYEWIELQRVKKRKAESVPGQ